MPVRCGYRAYCANIWRYYCEQCYEPESENPQHRQAENIPAQVILQNYMFERLLVQLASSAYKDKFVLKGGMLVAAIVGLDNRATMDLDTTLKNLPLTPEAIRSALEQVAAVSFDDGVTFEVGKISPIREDDIYGGYRVMLNAHFDTLITPLSIDVSTGDAITPHAVQYQFSEIFDDEKSYELWAYNIETVMAEKVETILRRGVFNTRPRDFYDAYILATTQKFDKAVFTEALNATATHRGTARQIVDVPAILHNIETSRELKSMWEKYRKQFAYAAHIEYSLSAAAAEHCCHLLLLLCSSGRQHGRADPGGIQHRSL